MKRMICLILASALSLAAAGALADQKVYLPGSTYCLTLPDGMRYDGPGGDGESFAYVDEAAGAEVIFFSYDSRGLSLEAIAQEARKENESVTIRRIREGIQALVYEASDPGDPPRKGMKCIGYVLADGDRILEICFWYATQQAADMTKTIIESIRKE